MTLISKTALVAIVAVFASFSASKPVDAATLGVPVVNVPDIVSNSLNAVYTAGTGSLTVTQAAGGGNILENPAGSFTNLASGSFSLMADLSNLAAPTGMLTIDGFTFDLVAVGNDGPTIELLWDVTTDPLGAYTFGQALTLLSGTNFPGDGGFANDWSTTTITVGNETIGIARADTLGVVPVPAALPLLVSGIAALGLMRRRQKA